MIRPGVLPTRTSSNKAKLQHSRRATPATSNATVGDRAHLIQQNRSPQPTSLRALYRQLASSTARAVCRDVVMAARLSGELVGIAVGATLGDDVLPPDWRLS
jgi:hypothetical protein